MELLRLKSCWEEQVTMCFQVCLEWNFTATLKRNAQNTPCEGHPFTPTNSLDKNMGVSLLGVGSRFFILFFKLKIQLPLQVGIQQGSVLVQALAMGTLVINKQTLAWNGMVILPRHSPNFLLTVRHSLWLHSVSCC